MNSLVNYALSHDGFWLYGAIFVSAVVENLFPPFPGDAVVLAGAYLAGLGKLNPLGVGVGAVLGGVGGAALVYSLGRSKGRGVFLSGRLAMLSRENLSTIERWFARHGERVVLFSRFLAGVRSAVSLAAGVGRMDFGKFSLYCSISMVLWNGVLIALGYSVGDNWERLLRWLGLYNRALVVLVALVVAGWAIMFYRRRRAHR